MGARRLWKDKIQGKERDCIVSGLYNIETVKIFINQIFSKKNGKKIMVVPRCVLYGIRCGVRPEEGDRHCA